MIFLMLHGLTLKKFRLQRACKNAISEANTVPKNVTNRVIIENLM